MKKIFENAWYFKKVCIFAVSNKCITNNKKEMERRNFRTRILVAVIFAISVSFTNNELSAQILVENSGKVHIGPRLSNTDLGNVLSVSIMGKNNDPFKTGAKLSFGDFGQQKNNGWNVFVGEYGNTDTDQLWLHGKNGFYLTTYNGTHVVAYCDYNTGGSMVLKTGLMLNEMYVSCDPQLMGPTASIKTPLEKLLKLESVGFEYTYNEDFETLPGSVVVNDPCTTPKEIADSINYAKRLSRNNEGKQKYGFEISSIETTFPELVTEDSIGYKYVNYTDLIPVLIAAIQQQQNTIDRQSVLIEDQANQLSLLNNTYRINANDSVTTRSMLQTSLQDESILYQNNPNPFNSNTTIQYYIATSATSATIYVFDLQGNSKLTFPIETFGNGSVNISAQSLSTGIYVYTLVVNNVIVDSKRMILTE